MESLLDVPRSPHAGRRATWGLATRLVERSTSRGRKAIVQIGDLTTSCVVFDVPVVGDMIHGDLPAVVEKVRVTRDGTVRIHARATDFVLAR